MLALQVTGVKIQKEGCNDGENKDRDTYLTFVGIGEWWVSDEWRAKANAKGELI